MQKIPKGSEAVGLRVLGCRRRFEVGPLRRDEGLGAVGQHQEQLETAMAVHPSQQIQGLTFKGMAPSCDRDYRRGTPGVGSGAAFLFRTSPNGPRMGWCVTTPTPAGIRTTTSRGM